MNRTKFTRIAIVIFLVLTSFYHSRGQSQDWPILKHYDQDHINKIALPVGGIGTGTISLGGIGDLRDWEIMNKPAKGFVGTPTGNRAPFFAIYVKPEGESAKTRALMGPVDINQYESKEGRGPNNHGLSRFRNCTFDAAYPFGQVNLSDSEMPVDVKIKAFNPFIPANADDSGIPIFILRYEVTNTTNKPMEVSISGSMENFIGADGSEWRLDWKGDFIPTGASKNFNEFRDQDGLKGIYMYSDGVKKNLETWGTMALSTSETGEVSYRTSVSQRGWGNDLLDFWDDFSTDGILTEKKFEGSHTPRASLAVKHQLAPGKSKEFQFFITWHFPNRKAWATDLVGNYYTTQYTDAWDVIKKTIQRAPELEEKTIEFVNAFISSDLPEVVKEAALFNMSTLRTQTCFRTADGLFFGWEGTMDIVGSCMGSCTHVWNYEQTTPFIFGDLAKLQRTVEFGHATNEIGLMSFRVNLPIENAQKMDRAAADGQMGTIMKMYRDWQLSGDDELLKTLWPNVKKSIEFCWIEGGWDADKDGVMEGCQHNTMDVEYFGPNPQMELWYLGALKAGSEMARYVGDKAFSKTCEQLFLQGSTWTDANIFNGEYYIQDIRPPKDPDDVSPLLTVGMGSKELSNPTFQLGNGCLVDQLVGQYMAHICDLGYLVKEENVKTTLQSIMKYNYKSSMEDHFNNMRSYALGDESALLMASFPYGRPEVPFPYYSEVMTGFEYTAGNGMLFEGMGDDGLKVIENIRDRYDGRKRSPFDEAECGHHYARAMTAYGSVLALTGFHYSGVEKRMKFKSMDGSYFWANGATYGTITQLNNRNSIKLKIEVLGENPLKIQEFELRDFGKHTFKKSEEIHGSIELRLKRNRLMQFIYRSAFLFILVFQLGVIHGQGTKDKLPKYDEEEVRHQADWLLSSEGAIANLYRGNKGNLVFSNGLIARTFSLMPDMATVAFKNLTTDESIMRSVRQEAEVTINGNTIKVGGLFGQPIHNYLLPEWIDEMHEELGNFHYAGYSIGPIKERFAWQKRLEWMPQDLPWPPQGKELAFRYLLKDADLDEIFKKSISDEMRTKLIIDDFSTLDTKWIISKSDAHDRTSFINEGKAGEIMALANSFAFAEQKVPKDAKVFIATINPGTDKSKIFGPGMALVFDDRMVKINLRTEENRFGFYNGSKTSSVPGMKAGKSVELRFEIIEHELIGSFSYDANEWMDIGRTSLEDNETPTAIRVGKTDWVGESSDHPEIGEMIRCRIESVKVYGDIPESKKEASIESLAYLKDIVVNVHYALYDHIPLMSKWITVDNNSDQPIMVDKFKSEILAVTDPESCIDQHDAWRKPKLMVETDYAFGDGMSPASSLGKSVFWNADPEYLTQVNYRRQAPYLLECYPKFGPAQEIAPQQTFESFRTWELAHKNYDRERQGLEKRKMYRIIAPWVTENPILMHVRKADNESVKAAIDQCAEVGFEMVIMTFGSGFNLEDQNDENIKRMKDLADYAHNKGVALGGYSLLASRSIDAENDVIMPEGQRPTFGNSPCLESEWGHDYFKKLHNFYEKTGQDILEHDGSYPGDACYSEHHPGHKGLEDSQWNQRKRIIEYYRWCRSKGIYLNIPDWYFLNGSNKTGMGYRETNWSLPRKQQEIIERQNVYDGTWGKTPSMGWMFVPLVQYHGGGEAATIEPLKDHLTHYEQRLANLFGAGVQACYRGPRLYDAPETKVIVEKWVDFYKKHRAILDGDVIHVRRPDGQDYDGLLHVNPKLEEKGLLMLYNPLEEPIKKKIDVDLYYTGLDANASISKKDGDTKNYELNRDYSIALEIEIPARGWTWYVIK